MTTLKNNMRGRLSINRESEYAIELLYHGCCGDDYTLFRLKHDGCIEIIPLGEDSSDIIHICIIGHLKAIIEQLIEIGNEKGIDMDLWEE